MAYANTAEKVEALRIVPKAREKNGQHQRPTTVAGREEVKVAAKEESKEERMRVALSAPHRRALSKSKRLCKTMKESDPRAGYPLGILYLTEALSIDQLNAGNRYVELYLRHGHHIVGHLPKFPSQAINDVSGGITTAADMTWEDAQKLRDQWHEAQTALADTGEWAACASALTSIGVMARMPKNDAELGSLRVGLNALHKAWL